MLVLASILQCSWRNLSQSYYLHDVKKFKDQIFALFLQTSSSFTWLDFQKTWSIYQLLWLLQQENSLSDLSRSPCYCFSQTNHFPLWNEGSTLPIRAVKLSSTFSWQGHQKHQAHRKHIQVLTLIELTMTNLAPTEARRSLFCTTRAPRLIMASVLGKCPLILQSCLIKVCFHTCSFLVYQSTFRGKSRSPSIVFLLITQSLKLVQSERWTKMVSVQRHFISFKSMYIQNYSYNCPIIQSWLHLRWERSFNSADGSQLGSECSNLRGR